MNNTGESEFANSKNVKYSLSFWQNFLITLLGASGLISLVADGPSWITYSTLSLTILLLLSVIRTGRKKHIEGKK